MFNPKHAVRDLKQVQNDTYQGIIHKNVMLNLFSASVASGDSSALRRTR